MKRIYDWNMIKIKIILEKSCNKIKKSILYYKIYINYNIDFLNEYQVYFSINFINFANINLISFFIVKKLSILLKLVYLILFNIEFKF